MERFLPRIHSLYARMDEACALAAVEHDFLCTGCEDTCCATLFFHHTLAECLVLWAGIRDLPADVREQLLARASRVREAEAARGSGSGPFREPCPALVQGRCLVYAHRPMVCRLHGMAHAMTLPDGSCRTGPGCSLYEQRVAEFEHRPAPLDRTPLYQDLAALEREIRAEAGFSGRIRLTVAGILADPPDFSRGKGLEEAS
ncbi:MAG: YkgJ family cysteine cluster protein [Proteobacteria bacterium]|nr:YkgJ family cysteine cluster protein [Pseudomonadota bacterium]